MLGVRGAQRLEGRGDAVHRHAALLDFLLEVQEGLPQARVHHGHVDVRGLGLVLGAMQEKAIDALQLQPLQAPRQLLLDPLRRDAVHQVVVDLRHVRDPLGVLELLPEDVSDLGGDDELVAAHLLRAHELLQDLPRHPLGHAVRVVRGEVDEVAPDGESQLHRHPLLLVVLQPVAAEADGGDVEARGAELHDVGGVLQLLAQEALGALGRRAVGVRRQLHGRVADLDVVDVVVVVGLAEAHFQRDALVAEVGEDDADVALLQQPDLPAAQLHVVADGGPLRGLGGRRAARPRGGGRRGCGHVPVFEAAVVEPLRRDRCRLVGPAGRALRAPLLQVLRDLAVGGVQGRAPSVGVPIDVRARLAKDPHDVGPLVVRREDKRHDAVLVGRVGAQAGLEQGRGGLRGAAAHGVVQHCGALLRAHGGVGALRQELPDDVPVTATRRHYQRRGAVVAQVVVGPHAGGQLLLQLGQHAPPAVLVDAIARIHGRRSAAWCAPVPPCAKAL
mmetsp:Transcript_89473/g.250335  ORF Transcript_89473/g.250335 Transcript_89473/m.250335 type:complete len:502 (+) Transcript_89473:777-2282(+)